MSSTIEAAPNGTSPAPTNGVKPRTSRSISAKPTWHIELLPVERIEASPYQPRLTFDPEEMADLVASVRVHGVQQPIIVRACRDDAKASPSVNSHKSKARRSHVTRYQLIAGERRLRACKEAGRKFIPAIIRDDLSDAQAAELALLENIQHSNLTVMEEAAAYKRLMLEFRMKEERIAKKVGKSVQTVRETIKLLSLPENVRALLGSKKLTASHGQHLLRLAPFESVCGLVAHKVASESITATALGQNLLPMARELCTKKLLVELDYRTKFDWKNECGSCPHKAYVVSGYGSYCLKPAEWQRKQSEAILRQQQEATRVLDEAKSNGSGEINTETLPAGAYRDLSYGQLPAGCCESCPCRSYTSDPRDPTKKRPICLDPERLGALIKAEREAHEETRRRQFLTLWNQAKDVLVGEIAIEIRPDEESALGQTTKTAALLVAPVIVGQNLRYGERENWSSLVEQVAQELQLELPWAELFDEEATDRQIYDLLQSLSADRLFLFAGCLMLAQEAREAVRFGGATPRLDFVLGRTPARQGELETEDDPEPFPSDFDQMDEEDESYTNETHSDELIAKDPLETEDIPVRAT